MGITKNCKEGIEKNGVKKKAYQNYLRNNNVEFARIDNTKAYSNINFPTLVIIGKEDILVDAIQSKAALDKIGNENISFKELERLNHFMVKKGADQKTNEIYDVEQVFKDYLINWINKLKK
ncbi:MAG: hypothetical protein IIC74_10690 [Bacteroidetes bacterium]|nr:hypothetical protein [Bacteroidota bacterium]